MVSKDRNMAIFGRRCEGVISGAIKICFTDSGMSLLQCQQENGIRSVMRLVSVIRMCPVLRRVRIISWRHEGWGWLDECKYSGECL